MRRLLILLTVTIVALVGCGARGSVAGSGSFSSPAEKSSAPASSTPNATTSAVSQMIPEMSTATSVPSSIDMSSPTGDPAPVGITVTTAGSDFGEILFDTSGQAIYLFDRETSTTPDCYDDCARAWPPVITDGAPAAMAGVRPELLGTALRSDGLSQVTYGGHPLYYYAAEGKNEVTCHDVREFGGLWLVVTPGGAAAA